MDIQVIFPNLTSIRTFSYVSNTSCMYIQVESVFACKHLQCKSLALPLKIKSRQKIHHSSWYEKVMQVFAHSNEFLSRGGSISINLQRKEIFTSNQPGPLPLMKLMAVRLQAERTKSVMG